MAEIIVIGGGAVALMSAVRLREAGHAVTVVERDAHVGQRSSWAGGGILCPLRPWEESPAVQQLWRESHAIYPALAGLLQEETGVDIEYRACGIEWRLETTPLSVIEEWHHRQSLSLVPGTAGHYCAALAQVRTPRVPQALARRLLQLGGRLRCGTRASPWQTGGRIQGVVLENGTRMEAEAVVLAAGAWSGALAEVAGLSLDVMPVRGQMLLFRHEPARRWPIIVGDDAYVIPRADGCVLVGSTMEDAGFNQRVTAEAHAALQQAAVTLCPDLKAATLLAQWVGLRPGTQAAAPHIGATALPGLWVNTGHFRNGIALAPASADALVRTFSALA